MTTATRVLVLAAEKNMKSIAKNLLDIEELSVIYGLHNRQFFSIRFKKYASKQAK